MLKCHRAPLVLQVVTVEPGLRVLWLPTISLMALRLPWCTKAPWATLAGTARSYDAHTHTSVASPSCGRSGTGHRWPPTMAVFLKRQSIKTSLLHLDAFSYCAFHLASLGTRPYRFPPDAPSWLMWSTDGGKGANEGVDGWHCLLLCLWGRATAKLLRGPTSWHQWPAPLLLPAPPGVRFRVSLPRSARAQRNCCWLNSRRPCRYPHPSPRVASPRHLFQRALFSLCCPRCQKSDDGWLWHLVSSLESLKWWDGHFNTQLAKKRERQIT